MAQGKLVIIDPKLTGAIVNADYGRIEQRLIYGFGADALTQIYGLDGTGLRYISEEEAKEILRKWREANPTIVALYEKCRDAHSATATAAFGPSSKYCLETKKDKKKVIVSAKTGHSWPKPKGSY
jgi:hypothetical protein